jgi:phosphoserine phosphatase
MTSFTWQLEAPIPAVVFDCDGTLSTLEGIDELAKKNGVGDAVQALTAVAMGQTGINANLYEHRLNLVKPTQEQILAQGQEYFDNVVTDVDKVIAIFQRLKKSVYIISAGLYPAVMTFGELLGIPRANIFAVPVQFNDDGSYRDYERASPLVNRDGKRQVLQTLKTTHPQVAYVGDGMNDLAVYDMAERFVGYGGVFHYEKLASACKFYIKTRSMASLLPLVLTEAEVQLLTKAELELYNKGLAFITDGQVSV